MASMTTASLSISNFISFLVPSKPRHQLSLSSATPQSRRDKLIPLVAQHDASLSPELSSVINPGFANANTLFFRSAYNVQVIVDDNEPEERLLGRFRREVMRAGVIQECKRRRFFENKQDEKKRRTRDAAKRNRRRRPFSRTGPPTRQEGTPTSKKDDDDEDNWEMPEGL
ncbi:Ribosomal protein S21 family protein [Euphorbia peplus]|nr:Ribosomal protein S21 family protein [Euphorbia peplus]